MNYIKINSIPEVIFAHAFRSEKYENILEKRSSCIEITYVTSGVLSLNVNGGSASASVGDIVCNIYSSDVKISAASPHAHNTVCFASDFEILSGDGAEKPLLLPFVLTPDPRDGKRIYDAIDEIIRCYTISRDETDSRTMCSGLFLRILSIVSASAKMQSERCNSGDNAYIRRAMDYIFQNLDKPIRQQDIANFLGITPEYLCQLFKKQVGMPAVTCVNRIKLDGIRTVMLREGITLAAASEMYGFADPNYVSRLYRNQFGENITYSLKKAVK